MICTIKNEKEIYTHTAAYMLPQRRIRNWRHYDEAPYLKILIREIQFKSGALIGIYSIMKILKRLENM